jgi:hypothetical protein
MLAIGVTMLVAPFAYRLAFRELSEVRYLNAAKQVRAVQQALLNYTIVAKNSSPNFSQNFGVLPGVSNSAIPAELGKYGLDDETRDGGILAHSAGWYFKTGERLMACVSLNMDKFGFNDAGLRQALMYVGDAAGYREENTIISVTGAWNFTNHSENGNAVTQLTNQLNSAGVTRQAAVCIDNETLEAADISNVYLYRNERGGTAGNKMTVDLFLGPNAPTSDMNNILNFGTLSTDDLCAVNSTSASCLPLAELNFVDGTIKPPFKITGGLILNGILRFDTNGFITTPNLVVNETLIIAEVSAPLAQFVKRAVGTARAALFVANATGSPTATIPSLRVQSLTIRSANIPAALRISGFNPDPLRSLPAFSDIVGMDNRLELKVKNLNVSAAMTTKFISVRGGHFSSSGGNFNTSGGNINAAAAFPVRIYNMGRTFSEVSGTHGFDLNSNSWIDNFHFGIDGLNIMIDNMRP